MFKFNVCFSFREGSARSFRSSDGKVAVSRHCGAGVASRLGTLSNLALDSWCSLFASVNFLEALSTRSKIREHNTSIDLNISFQYLYQHSSSHGRLL